jgi:hypothetical protein
VNQKNDQQTDLDGDNERIADECVRIAVKDLGTEKHQRITRDMKNQVKEKKNAGDADDELGDEERA